MEWRAGLMVMGAGRASTERLVGEGPRELGPREEDRPRKILRGCVLLPGTTMVLDED